jgi:DNA-binding NarL/FixJ family response regulator
MRVLVCDDHAVFAESLALVLNEHGCEVVGVTHTPEQALSVLEKVKVDVCVLDVSYPAGSVLDHLGRLRAVAPDAGLVLLSGLVDAQLVGAAVAEGVRGFAHKGQHVAEIVDTVRRVHAGEMVVEPRLLVSAAVRPPPRSEAHRLARFLTPREQEVLCRLVRGEDTGGLATAMGVTRATARSHIQSVLTKLGVHSRLEAATIAVRYGLVDAETGEWRLA